MRLTLLLASVLGAIPIPPDQAGAPAPAEPGRPIAVLRSERWIDTVRGAVRNVAGLPADGVALEVRFRNARGTFLGAETARLGPLRPGEEREFQVHMSEKVRSAATWQIIPRAALRTKKR